MKLSRITIEHGFYFLIFLVALGVRFSGLMDVPLSDQEAENAMQAYQLAGGENASISPGPGYALLTGATFFIFADSNVSARIWPVIAGGCLVLFPFLIRTLIGRKAAVIMAIGLALDPILVAASRMAGTDILAVGFGMITLGMVYQRKMIPAGIFGSLMILSGSSALQGILGFVIAWLIGGLLSRRSVLAPFPTSQTSGETKHPIQQAVLSGSFVIIAAGTLFFFVPEGLGALASSIPEYLVGWVTSSGVSVSQTIAALVIYTPIPLIFGSISAIEAWRKDESTARWFSLWAAVSLALVLFYPGRSILALSWVLIPLWGMAAMEIEKYFRLKDAELLPALGQAFLLLLLMGLGWLNLAGLSINLGDIQALQLRWAVIAGTILLAGVTTILIGLGWSFKTAQQGLIWGLLLGFGFYSVSILWGISQLRPTGEQELFAPLPISQNSGDLQKTLGDLSEWRTGSRDSLDVLLTENSPSLRWEMRKWPSARFMTSIPPGEIPSVIISGEEQQEPNLSIGYRGQGFTWSSYPAWTGVLPENWPNWLVYRNAPQTMDKVILWARGDLFPGGTIGETTELSPGSGEDFPILEPAEDLPFDDQPLE